MGSFLPALQTLTIAVLGQLVSTPSRVQPLCLVNDHPLRDRGSGFALNYFQCLIFIPRSTLPFPFTDYGNTFFALF